MSLSFVSVKSKGKTIACTIVTSVLLCAIFLTLVGFLYADTVDRAYEDLHIQTKQIKDDITLQLISDRENLSTMANFAAKLYKDGESYDLLFESFKSIGLIENVGILNSDNTFVTKAGSIDLDGLISFSDEKERGAYISGRVRDLTKDGYEIIRSAVPITVNGDVVGVLYGVIKLDKIGERYSALVDELDAQLFVYGKDTGDLIIDTIHEDLGNISFLKDRKYKSGYSYEEIESNDNGFSSFESVYKDENVHMHYSSIDELGWMIAMVRYDSQVFAEMYSLTQTLFIVFLSMVFIMSLFITILMKTERRTSSVTSCASDIRKILLETSGSHNQITEALRLFCLFTESRSTVFFNTDGEDYNYVASAYQNSILTKADRKFFMSELLRYTAEFNKKSGTSVNVIDLKVNARLAQTNPAFYEMLKKYGINDIIFSATTNNANHVTILSSINSKRPNDAQLLADKVSACFSIALYNKNHLNRTTLAAITDSLTGVWNRVAYKNDLLIYNEEKPLNFSCIYIDVNELHIRNNKYGHAAGDEMLLYIANSLKEVFFGNKVYRMGGDEFLVFCSNSEQEAIKKGIDIFLEQLELKGYHVAIGMSYRSQNTNTEEMVREAEVRMYEAKADYYQNKEQKKSEASAENEYVQIKTGILEIDTMLSVMNEHYNGIYRVSLDTDKAHRVLMPAYLKYNEDEDHFSNLFAKYISESVESNYHRALLTFRNYEAIKRQLAERRLPRITYKKLDGETVVLSVYKLGSEDDLTSDTLWVFAKK